ncbi:MAG: SUMF1/EgtB/PvdO family nonheme iron enzyme [Anaerolineales bacterium]|nr:SUMF1/EgtB/PvdO family nonheme iron enzyme [Anaerolineales bacterium]
MAEDHPGLTYEYLDFSIEITKGDGERYPVAVHSIGGDADESIAFPFEDVNELSRYLDKLQIALLRSARTHRQLSDEEVTVREFGGKLFRALFTQQIRSCYDRSLALAQSQGKGLRIRLDIEADELAGLPWEFLFDPDKGDYLSLSAHTPVVRYLDCGQIITPMEIQPPLQVLGMISSPADLDPLDVAQEKANLEKALEPLVRDGLAKLTWLADGSWRSLLDALNGGPWHIFHFVGHGDYDEEKHEGILAFEGANNRAQYINAGQLARLLGEHAYLRVVILNACESGQSGKEDVFSSTAATLLRRGVPAVIAMQNSISDQAAIELSQTFYKCLAAGLPVDAAISRARLALSLAVNNTLEWGTPVLLMRTEDGVLFNLKPPKEPAAQPPVAITDVGTPAIQTLVSPAIQDQAPSLAEQKPAYLKAAEMADQVGEIGRTVSTGEVGQRQPRLYDDATIARNREIAKRVGFIILGLFLLVGLIKLADNYDEKSQNTAWMTASARKAALSTSYTRTPTQVSSILGTVTPGPNGIVPPIISPIDGMTLIYISSGTFPMGSDSGNTDELPVHTMTLDAFWMDQTEVTNAQFAGFLNEMGNRSERGSGWLKIESYKKYGHILEVDGVWQVEEGYADHPATGVTWYGARAYCSWAKRQLPSEAQWEYAARDSDRRTYPWGEGINCSLANYNDCVGDTVPSGSYPQGSSPFGVLDMAGNVSEWVMDWYASDYYYESTAQNPTGPGAGDYRVQRGGNWDGHENTMRAALRGRGEPNDVLPYKVGFRCARPVAAGEVIMPTNTETSTSVPTTEVPTPIPATTEAPPPTLVPTRSPLPTQAAYDFTAFMVPIPAGSFRMGEAGKDDHELYLDEFYMDKTEVTNAQFAAFLNEFGNQNEGGVPWLDITDAEAQIHVKNGSWQPDSGYEDLPVVEVTWYAARAYCEWLGGRLPTEAEWEKAARGTLEGAKYPWGDSPADCEPGSTSGAQTKECDPKSAVPVGRYGANWYGLYDMAGNVWEWVMDWYSESYYTESPGTNPPGPETGDSRVLRGGSWSNLSQYALVYQRFSYQPEESTVNFGFRCAFSP